MVNREWAVCERDDGGIEEVWRCGGNHGGKRGRGRYREKRVERGGGGGCKQETCFEILIRGSGRGLEH